MKSLIVIVIILFGLFVSKFSVAGEQEPVNCKKQASRASFEKRAKKLAAEHCSNSAFKNLYISSESIAIDKDEAVATRLISYDCEKKKYLAVLQAVPDTNCADIQYQYIKADLVK